MPFNDQYSMSQTAIECQRMVFYRSDDGSSRESLKMVMRAWPRLARPSGHDGERDNGRHLTRDSHRLFTVVTMRPIFYENTLVSFTCLALAELRDALLLAVIIVSLWHN